MTAGAEDVAAPGTDPGRLRDALAVWTGPAGASRLDAALDVGPLPAADPSGADRADEVVAAWRRLGVRAALRGDPAHPAVACSGVPPLLAWRGRPPGRRPAVAVVGSRRASAYGRGVAGWLAEACVEAGVTVVSGGAVGIDAAAHAAAVGAGTTVVLGCGHDVAYPRGHAAPGGLFDRVLRGGGTLLSELPPTTAPHPGAVRARNRVVAGLVDAVVVVEGAARSGALITAAAAAEHGVTVLAVPGDVRAPGSAAPHRLLAEGAAPCTGPRDLLDAVLGGPAPVPSGEPAVVDRLAPLVGPRVAARLAGAWPRPLPLDLLADGSAGVPALLRGVERARAAGLLVHGADGVVLSRPPA